ncbi:Glutathione S-transferase [Mycena indigotica]|uniref:glutathione transferase n=1 Tax=Mycena indigotica TaxID=2126181 RepID=A0A8H6TG14_9AGAR|nr:Glutathione S-transferase [Mycena indigotica]KAF7316001.1 Glutathione S-transferase [Mycena indigotica]
MHLSPLKQRHSYFEFISNLTRLGKPPLVTTTTTTPNETPMLKLHGDARSTCTKRVATILFEKAAHFELVPVVGAASKSAEYKATMQPFGQIPVLEDDGYFLYESRAIGRYIAEKYRDQGTMGLIPNGDLKEMGRFECALSMEATQFLPAELLAYEAAFKPFKGGKTDPAEVARLTSELAAKLDAYDQILGKTKYLAGDSITLADLYHIPYADMLTNLLKSDLLTNEAARPNVARWYHDITSRPSWLAVKNGVPASA